VEVSSGQAGPSPAPARRENLQRVALRPGLPAAPRAGHAVRVDGHARRDGVLNNSATSGRGPARRQRRATGDCSRRESRSVRVRYHWAARARPIATTQERQAEQGEGERHEIGGGAGREGVLVEAGVHPPWHRPRRLASWPGRRCRPCAGAPSRTCSTWAPRDQPR